MEERKYEITYIIRPDLNESAKQEVVDRFDKILTDNGAKIIDSKDWKKLRLAYEIGGFTEGLYHIVNLTTADDESINEFDRLSKYSDNIIRHMIVKR